MALSCLAPLMVAMGEQRAAANPVLDWNARAGSAAVAACISPADDPLHESRLYAMVHVAIHDALNAIDRRSRPYAYDAAPNPTASVDAAVAAAARDVLVSEIARIPAPFPPVCPEMGIAAADTEYAAALLAIPDGPAKSQGIEVGRAAAAAIIALRADDGSDTPLLGFDYEEGFEPGQYRFTPGYNFVFAPAWGDVTPFVLTHSAQFRPRPPYRIHSKQFTADFEEVKALGGDGMTTPSARTGDQTQIALFWLESSPLAWNRMARGVAESRGLGVWESARLFGLLNMALADGYIASWDTKYHYNFWRPVTAIHTADDDGNVDTTGDPGWTPLQLTYPTPDYDSAHAVQGGAAAQVLSDFFGTDGISFSVCSLTLPPGSRCTDPTPVLRSFSSFSQAANENGLSRILVGIHFRQAVEEGIEHGRKVGRRAVLRFLRPTR